MNHPTAALAHLLYLHGFRSSPRSAKAQRMAAWVREHRPDLQCCCPQLPPAPREAISVIESACADWPRDRAGCQRAQRLDILGAERKALMRIVPR